MSEYLRKIIVVVSLLLISIPGFGMGLKIVKEYPPGILNDAMPWEIDYSGNWLYVASDDGLIQFNGADQQLFYFNNRRPLRSVHVEKDEGRVYAGGISEFGYFESSPFTSLNYVCLSDSIGDDKLIGNIWEIYKNEGKIIAQGDNELLIYDLNTGDHSVIDAGCKLDGSAMVNGILWLATDDGLKLLLGNQLVNAPNSEVLKDKKIRKILPKGNGLLIVTSDGVWVYENQHLEHKSEYNDIIKGWGEVFTATLRDNTLVLGTVSHGVGIIDLLTLETENYDESKGLPSNTVISLKFDNRGDLYVGMQYGLVKLLLNEPVENLDNTSRSIGSGYVMSQKGKDLYIGTNRGLFRADYDESKEKISSNIERIGDLRGQVWGLMNIDGDIFASLDQGLYIIDAERNPRRVGELSGVWDVRKMLGSNDRAYVGTYSGIHLLRKRNGRWEYDTHLDDYFASIYNFVQEKGNIMWNDKAEEGIDRLVIDTLRNEITEIRNYKATNDGFPLTADVYITRIDNNIYFGTRNGIYIYDEAADEIVREKELSKLLGNPKSVRRLKKVNGSLFALTDNELIEADPAGILDKKRITLPPSVTRPMHEGDLFFPIGKDHLAYPTRKGYLIFDYSEKSNSLWIDEKPQVRINKVKVASRGDSIVFNSNIGELKHEPSMTYRENSIRIEYGSWSDLEQGILYSTKINKEPWTTPSYAVSREFSDLNPGKYTFEVKAVTPEGIESEDSITFRILPPWWRSNWMLLIYAVFLISLIFVLLRWVQIMIGKRHHRQLREKDMEMERQQERHREESEEKDRKIEALEHEQMEKELKHKAQEVANMMMSLTHKNDTLQTVKRELQNISTMVPRGYTEVKRAIASLQDKVVIDIKSDDVLRRVEEEFDIVHDNFMKKLRERYPDLNSNEIMLCAYLKMNLSTKEIAPLLNISQRGVETIRYRLRKKLGLEREDSLSSFISNFH